VGLCYLDTGELYDDLIELVLVYVPTVVKEPQKTGISIDDDLYVFARFFAVSSSEEAAAYADEFETNELAKELIRVYNSMLADRQNLEKIENSPYFFQRLNEAQLAEARAEAEAKGEARGEARGEAKGANQMAQLINDGYDVNTALKMITSKFADE
jgi:hypothetical protein